MRTKSAWTVIAMATTLLSSGVYALTPELELFEKKIRPVLVENCYECHSATSKKLKGGLRADSREALIKGGETGPAIAPGKPEDSLLIKAMAHRDPDLTMPPKKAKLPDAVIADFERWVRDGAVWPAEQSAVATPANSGGFDLEARKKRLPWIWETPKHHKPPEVKDANWPVNSVDRFILARLEKEGLHPSPPAEPEIWLRRVYFALIGLPPSPEQISAFLNDHSATAREWVLDQLLASPQFGERWARHWLDLVRYAESRGHESDYIIPNAYEYRDYVIRALNADVPYDAFVREHIAGDLLQHPRKNQEKGFNESILGTGWAFLGEEIHAPVDTRQDENDRIDNRIDVLSKTFLGLTVACARCHDHKFDAISQRDYYALAGFFISSGERLARFETMDNNRSAARQLAELKGRWMTNLAAKIPLAEGRVLSKTKEYLLAAAEAAAVTTNAAPKAGARLRASALPAAVTEAISQIAAEQMLETNLLAQWTAAVLTAVNDKNDVLHPFAKVALANASPVESTNNLPDEVGLPDGAKIVLDFGNIPQKQWYEDGVAFGPHPVRAGELVPVPAAGSKAAGLRIATRAAAQTDPDWRDLDLSPGV